MKYPDGKGSFHMNSILKESTEITAKADNVAKSFGLKNINELFTLIAKAKKSSDYSALTRVLDEKVGRARLVRFCYELIQLYDFDPSAQMDLRLWGKFTTILTLPLPLRIINMISFNKQGIPITINWN